MLAATDRLASQPLIARPSRDEIQFYRPSTARALLGIHTANAVVIKPTPKRNVVFGSGVLGPDGASTGAIPFRSPNPETFARKLELPLAGSTVNVLLPKKQYPLAS